MGGSHAVCQYRQGGRCRLLTGTHHFIERQYPPWHEPDEIPVGERPRASPLVASEDNPIAQFSGEKTDFARFLSYMDEDDATNLPNGIASLARNQDYTYTSAKTRNGINTAMTGINKSPITGLFSLVYLPSTDAATDVAFQLPVIFDFMGALQFEAPLGTGRMNAFTYNILFTPPQNSHALGAQAYNRLYTSFSNLITPTSRCSVLDLKTNNLDPYGQKPVGWAWIANTPCLVGEMAAPSQIQNKVTVSVGNGHTYRCIQAGMTGAAQPIWPLTEGGVIAEVVPIGVTPAIWEEYTMVLANRLAPPSVPAVTLSEAFGAIPAAMDVYAVITLLNTQGETIASVPAFATTLVSSSSVDVKIPVLAEFPGWVRGLSAAYVPTQAQVYVSIVANGSPAPPLTGYEQVVGGPSALGSTVNVANASTSGIFPPSRNSARITPGMIPSPIVAPVLTRESTGGAFPVGRDVWVRQTYTNAAGETTLGPSNSLIDTQLNDGVQVEVVGLDGYIITGVNLYEADVPTGSPEPDPTEYAFFGSFQPGDTPVITASATGQPAPIVNTTGTGGNIVADTEQGGPNDTQGYRYAILSFQNRNGSNSGVTNGSVVQYIVDEDGWELAVFNVAVGPLNVAKRLIGFAVADGVPAGPFGFIAQSMISDGIQMLQTAINDNVTTQTVVNFTDDQLLAAIAAGDALTQNFDTIWPLPCVDLFYSASLNRFFQSGMPGFASTHAVSQAGDAETYQGSTCFLQVGNNDGERVICVREFTNGTVISLRERSGFLLTASSANPVSWDANREWSKVGPCGPRAVDVAGNFLVFIHRSGVYKYESGEPELITKEIPYWWKTINWAAQQTIWCVIDVEKKVVRCGFPVGKSTVPNQELTINYIEGWAYPIHFSTYSGKMIAVDACRKLSINDIAAFCAVRMERALPPPPDPPAGVTGIDEPGGDFYQSQFCYGSSAADGTVQAITPGIYSDNGVGIDHQVCTVSAGAMQALSKPEGFNLNARGNGSMNATFLSGRDMKTDWETGGTTRQLKVRPFDLSPNQSAGISRNVEGRVNEHWKLQFDNGKVPGAWMELKFLSIFTIPMYDGRDGSEGSLSQEMLLVIFGFCWLTSGAAWMYVALLCLGMIH